VRGGLQAQERADDAKTMPRQEVGKRRARAVKALQRVKTPLTTLNGGGPRPFKGKKIWGRKMNSSIPIFLPWIFLPSALHRCNESLKRSVESRDLEGNTGCDQPTALVANVPPINLDPDVRFQLCYPAKEMRERLLVKSSPKSRSKIVQHGRQEIP
jgi:hypothetical protein